MNKFFELLYVSKLYWLLLLVGVIAFVITFRIIFRAITEHKLFTSATIKRGVFSLAFAIPVITIESWYAIEEREARTFVQREVIDRLNSAIARGQCGWDELQDDERKVLEEIQKSERKPYFLIRQHRYFSIEYGRDGTSCMINVGFWSPLNRLTCELLYGDCESWPGSINIYDWSEKKEGTARQGWISPLKDLRPWSFIFGGIILLVGAFIIISGFEFCKSIKVQQKK